MIRNFISAAIFILLLLPAPTAWSLNGEQAETLYRQGQDALNSGRYDEAVGAFSELVEAGPDQSDRALYWHAYALHKLGRKKEALVALRQVINDHPESPWRDDAEALRIEIDGVQGDDQLDSVDDQLKLYALDALHQVAPDRAFELLTHFLAGDHSRKLKEHALFMLAQTGSERAAEILVDTARGKKNPELQSHAVRALGMLGSPSAINTLVDLYKTTDDRETKKAVMEAMIVAGTDTQLADLLGQEKDPKLLEEGLRTLGAMGAVKELRQFARTLPAEHLPHVLHGLGIAGDAETIFEVLERAESDSGAIAAIQSLAIVHNDETNTIPRLIRMYDSNPSQEVKAAILQALMIQNDGESLLRIFRQEKNGELKRQALQLLVAIDNPEAQQLLEDLLKG